MDKEKLKNIPDAAEEMKKAQDILNKTKEDFDSGKIKSADEFFKELTSKLGDTEIGEFPDDLSDIIDDGRGFLEKKAEEGLKQKYKSKGEEKPKSEWTPLSPGEIEALNAKIKITPMDIPSKKDDLNNKEEKTGENKRKESEKEEERTWKLETEEYVQEILEDKINGQKRASAYLSAFEEVENVGKGEFARELREKYLSPREQKSDKEKEELEDRRSNINDILTPEEFRQLAESVFGEIEGEEIAKLPETVTLANEGAKELDENKSKRRKAHLFTEEKQKEIAERKKHLDEVKGIILGSLNEVRGGKLNRKDFLEQLKKMEKEEENHTIREFIFSVISVEEKKMGKSKNLDDLNNLGEKLLSGGIRTNEFDKQIYRMLRDSNGNEKKTRAIEKKQKEIMNEWRSKNTRKLKPIAPKLAQEEQEEDFREGKRNGSKRIPPEKLDDMDEILKIKTRNDAEKEIKKSDIENQLQLIEKDLQESGSIAEFNESITDLCEGKNQDVINKIEKRKKEILEKRNFEKESAENKEALGKAAQAVIEAEAKLKKAEKNDKSLMGFFSMFKKKGSDNDSKNVSEELQHARDVLQKAKDEYDSLTRQNMEMAFQNNTVNEKEQKFNSIQAKMDAKMLLEDKRMQALEKDGGNAITRGFKKTLEGYRKLSFKQHMLITGGLILASSSVAPFVLGAALSGTVATGALFAGRALSAIGGTGMAESVIENRLKKHREKAGQTIEAQRKFAEEYVAQGVEKLDINTLEGKMAFLDKANRESDDEINRRLNELRHIENKQNIAKWVAALGVGAFFAWGGPEKIFKFGKEKIFGRTAPAPGNIPSAPTAPGGLSEFSAKLTPQGGMAEKLTEEAVKKSKEIIPNIRNVVKGDSIWSAAEKQAKGLYGNEAWFSDKIQRTHFIDTAKREILKMRGGKEFLRPGDKIDFSFMRNLGDKLRGGYAPGGRIAPGSEPYKHIKEVSDTLGNWVRQNPGKTLTTDRAREIIQGVGKAVKSTIKPGVTGEEMQTVKNSIAEIAKKAGEKSIKFKPSTFSAEQVQSPFIEQMRNNATKLSTEWIDGGILKGISPKNMSRLGNQSAEEILNLKKPAIRGISNRDWKEIHEAAKMLKEYSAPVKGESFAVWTNRIKSGIASHNLKK